MIDELNEESLDVCVCAISGDSVPYIAHCFQLDLIGEGQTKREAVSRLEQLIKIQCSICQDTDSVLWVPDVHPQWIKYYQTAEITPREKRNLVIQKHKGPSQQEEVVAYLKIDKSPRIIVDKESWPFEFPLTTLIDILSPNKIFWRISEEPNCGYFVGHWPAGSDGPLQSYPFYLPTDNNPRWYHLRNIGYRFGLDDLRTKLTQVHQNTR